MKEPVMAMHRQASRTQTRRWSVLGPRSSLLGPQPEMPSPTVRSWLVAAVLSGALLWLCYFPVACGWLAWVALIPLLCLVRSDARPWRVYLGAWLGALVFYAPAMQWMRVADHRMYATWIGLTLYCSLFFPAGFYLLRRLDRRTPLPLALTVPVVWTALEFFRGHF